jgi:S-adenosylmethionine decarboxylase
MKGLHIIADFYDCPKSDYLNRAEQLRSLCLDACERVGLSVLGSHFYQFDSLVEGHAGGALGGGGATGAVVLAESHVAIHTWPERAGATLDIYVCNMSSDNSDKAEALYAVLKGALQPGEVVMQRLWRGKALEVVCNERVSN